MQYNSARKAQKQTGCKRDAQIELGGLLTCFAEWRKIVILYEWSLNSIGSKKEEDPIGLTTGF